MAILRAGEGRLRAPIEVAYIRRDWEGQFYGWWATFIHEPVPTACPTIEEMKAAFMDEWKRIVLAIGPNAKAHPQPEEKL